MFLSTQKLYFYEFILNFFLGKEGEDKEKAEESIKIYLNKTFNCDVIRVCYSYGRLTLSYRENNELIVVSV